MLIDSLRKCSVMYGYFGVWVTMSNDMVQSPADAHGTLIQVIQCVALAAELWRPVY